MYFDRLGTIALKKGDLVISTKKKSIRNILMLPLEIFSIKC